MRLTLSGLQSTPPDSHMPARKRTNLNPDAPPESLSPRQAVSDPEALSEDVERILADLGEGASSVAVYREDDTRPGKFNFVARVPAPQFSNDYVATEYGGGNYQLIISDKVQGPLNPVYFSVDRRVIGKAFAVTGTPVTPGGDGAFKDRLLEILLARALTPPAPVVQPASNSAQETLQIIAALAPLLRGGGSGADSMEMVAALLTSATEMARNMAPQDGMASVATQLLPVVERLVTAAGAKRLPASPLPRPPIVHTGTPPAAAAPLAAPVEVKAAPVPEVSGSVAGTILPNWLAPFRQFGGVLVSLADTEADPSLYADVCVDQLSNNEDAFRSAVEAMEAGTLRDDVLNAVPALKETEQRIKFVEELVTRVEEGLREVIKQETEGEGEGAANG